MNLLDSGIHVNALLVFLEGLLSFLSPCVLPILPIYMGYLAGQTTLDEVNGRYVINKQHVLVNTLAFILGISMAFVLLALAVTSLGGVLSGNRQILTRASGIVIILMGLLQIGFLDLKWLQKERRFNFRVNASKMNPLMAFVMGFIFSFSWTPCVGPALSSVLLMAGSSASKGLGYLLVSIYALGFSLPFLFLGLFTTSALQWLDRNGHVLKYAAKLGGVVLILLGIMLYTGWGNNISSYVNEAETPVAEESAKETDSQTVAAYDFKLVDQFGNTHQLSEYKGKVVFLNFWATWCPPCRQEMPHIQSLYESYGKNENDVIFLSVAGPNQGKETDEAGVVSFLKTNGYSWPVVMDLDGSVFEDYQINALPTTFMIDKKGNIYGYVSGQLTEEIMKKIIEETLAQK